MGFYEKTIRDIKEKKMNKEAGNHNMIPISYTRYAEYFEGFSPGDYIGILGMTGSGKSRLCRSWIYDIIDFSLKTGYKTKILYFALEDPEIPVAKKIMSHYLYTRHNISVSSKALSSRTAPLPDKYIDLLERDRNFWANVDDMLYVINSRSTPDEIEAAVLKAKNNYPNHHIIVAVDNQSNITQDVGKDISEWSAIKRFSRDIVRRVFCPLGITTITVLQVDADTEKNTFRNANKGSLTAVEPNLSSIGDAKVVAKNMHYVFGLFDPWRFEIKEYPYQGAYNTEVLRGRFRSLIHLKSNEDEIAPRLGLYFDGKHELFQEMPIHTDKEALEKIYNRILAEEQEKRDRFKKTLF